MDSVQDEISSQLAEVESRELARIEDALDRMRNGDYGIREGQDAAFRMARLHALPYATLCIKCQARGGAAIRAGGADADWGRLLDSGSSDLDVSINDIELDVP